MEQPEEPGLFRITAAETGNPLVKTYYDATETGGTHRDHTFRRKGTED